MKNNIVSICKLYKSGEFTGYRLYNLETKKIKDVSYSSAVNNINLISNMDIVNRRVEFIGGQSDLYPSYDLVTQSVKNGDILIYIGKLPYSTPDLGATSKSIFNHVSDYKGNIVSISPMEIQSLIVDSKIVNVAESYTGRMSYSNMQEIAYSGIKIDDLYEYCFSSLSYIYEYAESLKDLAVVGYHSSLYDIAEHKKIKATSIKGRKYKLIEYCGILDGIQLLSSEKLQSIYWYKSIRYVKKYLDRSLVSDGKLPLSIKGDKVYYVKLPGKGVEAAGVYGYLLDGLSEVLGKKKLLKDRSDNNEASFCLITANKYYILAISGLQEFSREAADQELKKEAKERSLLDRKLKLIGINNIETDNNGKIIKYYIKDKRTKIVISNSIYEFDLQNIEIDWDKATNCVDFEIELVIPDDHNLIYIGNEAIGRSVISSKYVKVVSIDCNDVALVKRLLPYLTQKYSRSIEWYIGGSVVTYSLIKWVYQKGNIKLIIRGGIPDSLKVKIVGLTGGDTSNIVFNGTYL